MKKPFGVGAAERLNHKIEAILLLVKCQSVRDLWSAWVDLNHRPRPYQGTTVRFHNDLQDLQEPRGLPKYVQVAQDVANCGLDCGLEISLSEGFGDRVQSLRTAQECDLRNMFAAYPWVRQITS